MKINGKYITRKIGDEYYAVPLLGGEDVNVMIRLNETGAFLFDKLLECETENALIDALTAEYAVDRATAETDVHDFITAMKEAKILD
ncbi:MAG: PqqD family protein [Eubacteriales bacterium]|nr:PqqD family protein [Eubacteriales bacterium]